MSVEIKNELLVIVHRSIRMLNVSFVAENFMDLIHFLLSVLIGLFPKLLQFSPAPQTRSSSSRRPMRTRLGARHMREFIVGHRAIGWYCLFVEVAPDDWLRYRVVGIESWDVSTTNSSPFEKTGKVDQNLKKDPDGQEERVERKHNSNSC